MSYADEVAQRAKVVEVTKSWLRTPYHHMGRVKGAGVDCATLLAEVCHEAGLIEQPIEIPYYPIDWNLHREEEKYLNVVLQYTREIEFEQAKPGDVVIYHFGRTWSHGGIIIEWPIIIHAVLYKNVMLANAENDGLLVSRKRRFFSPWGSK